MIHPSKNKRAFSLIEAAIVLAIVGLVIGGIWIAAATVRENYKVNQAINGVNIITHNVQQLLRASGVTTGQIHYYDSHYFTGADGFILQGVGRKDPWGNDIQFDQAGSNTYSIGFYDLTKPRCMKLIKALTMQYKTNKMYRVDHAGGTETYGVDPWPPTVVASMCDGTTATYFYFGI